MENYKEIMDDLGEKFGVVIDWTNNNVMPMIQQLCDEIIQYGIYKSWLWIAIWCITVILLGVCGIKLWKFYTNCNRDYDEIALWALIIYLVIAIIAGITVVIAVPYLAMRLVKLYTAPSLYLLEYFSNLLE